MKKRKIWLLGLFVVVLAVGIRANIYKRELISAIAGPTLPVFPTATISTNSDSVQQDLDGFSSNEPPVLEEEAQKPKCNGPQRMLVLVVGADNDVGYYNGLADVIKVFRIDFVTASVDILSIPRHVWVDIPGLEEQDIYEGKINQTYFYGNLYRLEGGGPTLLARTLYESFGLPVDHYFAINMATFTNVIDQLGGIDFYNPEYASDNKYYFAEGDLHLNGEDALRFSKIRYYDGVFARMDRQVLVVKAIASKLLSPKYFIQIPSLINSNLDQVVTSLGENEIEMLVCIATKINLDEITSLAIGEDFGVTERKFSSWAKEGTQALIPDYEKIRAYMQAFIRGGQ